MKLNNKQNKFYKYKKIKQQIIKIKIKCYINIKSIIILYLI